MRVEPLSPATQQPALEYLARDPYLNVFLRHLLLHDLPQQARRNVFVALDERGVAGVAYCGRQLVVAAESSAIAALAGSPLRRCGARMIIGPRENVVALWQILRSEYARPRVVRDRQLVMMVDRARLRSLAGRVAVRHAKIEEWRAVAEGSAAMIAQELEYDPRRDAPSFDLGVRQMIERKLWWVGVAGSELCFFCNIGPWCERTIQLQGIWTPPKLRGRGLATASLSAICDRLLDVSPTLSLYVNDFNEDAIALYRRVGFEHVGDFQTLLF
jgi:RimJ/RimL family protein N-acetyltransferase